MENPCFNTRNGEDCPRRKPGCGAHCKEWARYISKRDGIYKIRKDNEEIDSYAIEMVNKRKRHLKKRK